MQTTPDNKPDRLEWHRLLGLFLTIHFEGSPYGVEVEKDLTVKKQLLDVILIERDKSIPFNRYPDGLENMARYNLISYKSLHESFDLWSFQELHGHYVNCRKQMSPAMNKLVDADQFRLYALSTRMPQKLMEIFSFKPISTGVYELQWDDIHTRLIVLSQIPPGPYNDLWRLFSAKPAVVEEARKHYIQNKHSDYSVLTQQLYEYYLKEELPMTYTIQQFKEEFVLSHLKMVSTEKVLNQYSPEERVKNLSPEERLKDLSSDQVLKRFSPEERLKNLSPEERLKNLSPEDMLRGLSPEQLDILLQLGQKQKAH